MYLVTGKLKRCPCCKSNAISFFNGVSLYCYRCKKDYKI